MITSLAGSAAPKLVITSLAGFVRSPPPASGRPHSNVGGFQVGAGGFTTDAGRLPLDGSTPAASTSSLTVTSYLPSSLRAQDAAEEQA